MNTTTSESPNWYRRCIIVGMVCYALGATRYAFFTPGFGWSSVLFAGAAGAVIAFIGAPYYLRQR